MGYDRASPRSCVHHPGVPAIAICTRCEGDICVDCHHPAPRGWAVCSACQAPDEAPVDLPAWERRDRDYTPANLARTVVRAIRSPMAFFADISPDRRWMPAATFGLVCMAFGLTIAHVWQVVFLENPEQWASFAREIGVTPDSLQTLLFISVPFSVLLGFAIQTGLQHAAIRLAGVELDVRTTAKIVGYSSAAYVLMVIPPVAGFALGHFLAIIWLFHLRSNALRHFYEMSPWKSMVVVGIPLMLSVLFMAV